MVRILIVLTLIGASYCCKDSLAGNLPEYRFERMWPALQQPWYFDAYDFAFDSQGHVYVADGFFNRVVKLSASGEVITSWQRPVELSLFELTTNALVLGVGVSRNDQVIVLFSSARGRVSCARRSSGRWSTQSVPSLC